ncbi:hypothetical protein HanXRQr2_Chr04g0174851 [Helianthus annuus]|uniref:Uncharacterized protein n=1 Tax=Helianthus annuus TaxID=4232 RepID=A0A251V166_HELAN|nr:hypothetical protein HanXRQr2_Chr04g0174851 [Helianthus annuus]KAJ0581620.1 hypothetical protein HanHA300_Chr04g0143161 [Helianthus annuus]KAJ0589628.1 hypothetical protein HanIR_Chr04g0188421 [Helianthus annuus]KAJ0597586.1 hypothetical protein HanHA89_Chr04g0156341 [Helianthus annuus]KAJ0758233.1 hypothetical protein HanLR1_Chr04g0148061 [Helianthus annuus]
MVLAVFSSSESLSGGLSSRVSAAVQLKVITIKKAMMEVLVTGSRTDDDGITHHPSKTHCPAPSPLTIAGVKEWV